MSNRLADETSPYLRQHRDNPVDWYPWGEEAFARATAEDKPILLSVGYSACHWCHVMAHESFEDPATAAVMNELFVNVKVDREERPDVDAVYMDAVQQLTGQGGWPMTVFLMPDGRPFFGGTYFPNEARHGMPAFTDLCLAVAEHWRDERDELRSNAEQLTEALSRSVQLAAADDLPGREVVTAAVDQLVEQHDREWGGFGGQPKFPQSMSLELLLRVHHRAGDPALLEGVTTSLDAMASGGIYDHLGGGFARYSVDNFWMVPHFEKMLYDQALLARAYLHAWQVTGEERYRQVLDETIDYVRRDLRDPAGGFHSAEDADSEGEEGKFYVWRAEEIEAVLDPETAAAVIEWYGVTRNGNFEGSNILHRPARGDLIRPEAVERGRAALLEARNQRVRPGLDDKVLTEWNGLMLATLAEAAAATGDERWLADAVQTAEFLLAHLRGEDGRWLRSWQAGADGRPARAQHLAYAADHAALVDGFTRLAEASGDARWIAEARSVADALLDLFWDDEAGGVFTTGRDAEALIARQKDFQDNATPSANSAAALALLRLAALTGEARYLDAVAGILRLFGPLAGRYAAAFAHLLAAVDLADGGTTEIVVTGDRPDLVAVAHGRYLPDAVLAWGEPYDSPLWADRAEGAAHVCRDFACLLPVTDPEALAAQLDGTTGSP
ncbi:MAG: thioredoxin domain-containing protein [Acidimicrobiales bacterium]|nr:thioredoxin domain-containing protein [Acidimicrobiales bacterium]